MIASMMCRVLVRLACWLGLFATAALPVWFWIWMNWRPQ